MSCKPPCAWLLPVALLVPPVAAQVVLAPPTSTPVQAFTGGQDVAADDLDGDGDLDIVLVDTPGLATRLGDGAGGFGPPLLIPAHGGAAPAFTLGVDLDFNFTVDAMPGSALVLADMDGDSLADLVHGRPTILVALHVLPGHGDGSFGPGTSTDIGSSEGHMTLDPADADLDGDLDLALVDWGFSMQTKALLLTNDGSGALAPAPLPLLDLAHAVGAEFADLDADGRPDLLVDQLLDAGTAAVAAEVLLAQPSGGFAFAGTLPSLVVDTGDVDGDGVLDLLAVDAAGSSLHRGAGDGSFLAPAAIAQPHATFVRALADFDADGLLDVVTHRGEPGESGVHRGLGDGTFESERLAFTWTTSAGTTLPSVLDLDGDDRPDLLGFTYIAAAADRLDTALNATYPAGGPLLDLGHALPGGKGWPIQIASGSFVGGQPVSFSVWGAPSNGPVLDVLGLSQLDAPFQGGVMVPHPTLLLGPFSSSETGTLSLAGAWPAGLPSGTQAFAQFWFPDGLAEKGFAASSGVRITAP